jgi:CBS domain-containing protein
MFSNSIRSVPKVASELMASRLQTVAPSSKVGDALRSLLKFNHSGMPVVDAAGNYLGVFSEKCCLRALRETPTLEEWETLPIKAAGAMVTKLFCLSPEEDAIAAIGGLLKHKVSGAPVTDPDRTFRGTFSEKTSMRVIIGAAYDSLPSATVGAFMDSDTSRLIDEQTTLARILRTFIETPLRRLPVVRSGKIVGMVSRRDLLRAAREMPTMMVADCMDCNARTVTRKDDLLSLAEIFLTTPYRRLPVVEDGKLVGQVSRRDVLNCAYHLMDPVAGLPGRFLYLSALEEDASQRFVDA